MLGEAHKKLCMEKMQPNKETITDLAKKTLLSTDHVQMWLEHFDGVYKNRTEGAKRAAAKKQLKSRKKGIIECSYFIPLLDLEEGNFLISL